MTTATFNTFNAASFTAVPAVKMPKTTAAQALMAVRLVWKMFWALRCLNREMQQLAEAEDHILRDINISRGDAHHARHASLGDMLKLITERPDLLS